MTFFNLFSQFSKLIVLNLAEKIDGGGKLALWSTHEGQKLKIPSNVKGQ